MRAPTAEERFSLREIVERLRASASPDEQPGLAWLDEVLSEAEPARKPREAPGEVLRLLR